MKNYLTVSDFIGTAGGERLIQFQKSQLFVKSRALQSQHSQALQVQPVLRSSIATTQTR
jgi:hypothetical protein